MRMGLHALLRFGLGALAFGVCTLGTGCGGDDDDVKGDASEPQPCLQSGQIDSPCTCSADQPPGYRQCKADFTWGMCRCPEGRGMTDCENVGDPVTCPTNCPGEKAPRMTKCLQGGTFDCSCSK